MYKNKRGIIGKILLCVLFGAFACLLFAGCNAKEYRTESFFSMGTVLNLTVYADKDVFDAVTAETKEVLSYAESLNGDGAVGRFNSAPCGSTVELDETVYSILKKIKEDPALDGFNPLFAPLVDLWGFSLRFLGGSGPAAPYDRQKNPDGGIPLPDEKYIKAFLSLSNLDELALFEEDGKYYCLKNIPSVTVDGIEYGAQMDLGGCIKGYCTDRITEICLAHGIEYGYVSFGTSSVSLLKNKSGDWTVNLTSPENPSESYFSTKLSEGNVSTSGDYENRYTVDGVDYCHIIGPDGYPVKNARSVTVIGSSALYCDMLSTALMTVPLDKMKERIAETAYAEIVYSFGEGDSFDAIAYTSQSCE